MCKFQSLCTSTECRLIKIQIVCTIFKVLIDQILFKWLAPSLPYLTYAILWRKNKLFGALLFSVNVNYRTMSLYQFFKYPKCHSEREGKEQKSVLNKNSLMEIRQTSAFW